MRNSLFIFKPPNQREDIIDKFRECDKDRDTAPTRPNSVYPHHFSSHKKVADQNFKTLPQKVSLQKALQVRYNILQKVTTNQIRFLDN
jgi:hypothetical protein